VFGCKRSIWYVACGLVQYRATHRAHIHMSVPALGTQHRSATQRPLSAPTHTFFSTVNYRASRQQAASKPPASHQRSVCGLSRTLARFSSLWDQPDLRSATSRGRKSGAPLCQANPSTTELLPVVRFLGPFRFTLGTADDGMPYSVRVQYHSP
jgi:hypothetical protein